MNKILIIILITLTTTFSYSSGSNNTRDNIYTDIDYWRNTGLISSLPPIRPYPSQYLISILEKVIEKGSEADIIKAKKYLETYTVMDLEFSLSHNYYSALDNSQIISGIKLEANLPLHKNVFTGIDIAAYGVNFSDTPVTSKNRDLGIDLNMDDMNFDIAGQTWHLLQGLNHNTSFGTDKIWLQTGMMLSSFGPLFSDSVVLNPRSKQAAHFSATWLHDLFTASYLLLPIVASNNIGNGTSDNKFLHLWSIDLFITDFWEFQFYETVVYGGKGIKPVYLLPFSEFFYTAGQTGTSDINSLMGLSSRFQLPENISLTGTVYVDDIHASEMVELNFSAKMKLAGQIEVNWTPKDLILNSLRLNYTAILPYMYTHTTGNYALKEYMNYENYTNGGVTMGPSGMEPNSDKLGINLDFNLPKGFKLSINSEYIRHGNSSSTSDRSYDPSKYTDDYIKANDTNNDGIFDNEVPTDGSIFDTGYGRSSGYLYQLSNPFLTQDILEKLLFNELVLTSSVIELGKNEIFGEFGYAFVYIENNELIKGNNSSESYIRLSLNYRF